AFEGRVACKSSFYCRSRATYPGLVLQSFLIRRTGNLQFICIQHILAGLMWNMPLKGRSEPSCMLEANAFYLHMAYRCIGCPFDPEQGFQGRNNSFSPVHIFAIPRPVIYFLL